MAAGLQSAGARVVRIGRVPTPTLAYASQGRHGVMITASHNPPTDNGIKLFADGTEYGDDDETRIEGRIEGGSTPTAWRDWGDTESVDYLDEYRGAVADYAESLGGDPSRLTVAVDAGTAWPAWRRRRSSETGCRRAGDGGERRRNLPRP